MQITGCCFVVLSCVPTSLIFMNEQNQAIIEQAKWELYLERIMATLPLEQSEQNHRLYLSGVIDTLHNLGQIPENIHKYLYEIYGS
jgi:hypothetical protein